MAMFQVKKVARDVGLCRWRCWPYYEAWSGHVEGEGEEEEGEEEREPVGG